MRPNPKPDDVLPCPDCQRPIPQADARRKDRPTGMNLLEAEAGMEGVAAKVLIGKTGLGLNLRRQGGERLAKPRRRV
jgi:hypothetical protein